VIFGYVTGRTILSIPAISNVVFYIAARRLSVQNGSGILFILAATEDIRILSTIRIDCPST
jgi:hypothetical protein